MAPRKTRGGGTPDFVTKAAEAANEIHKEVYGPDETATQEQAAQVAAPGENATVEGGDIQPVKAPATEESTANTDKPAPPPEPKPEVTPSDPDPVVDWEGKYKVLQGKYNAEVPRLNHQLQELRGQVRELLDAQRAATEKPATETKQENVVTEQELVDYGEDLIDLIRRVASSEAAKKTQDLTPTLEEIKGQVQKSKSEQAVNSVYSKLDAEVQDWKKINKSQEFIGWLQEEDPYAGAVRQDLLSDAFARGDSNRVVAFFKGYLAEQRAVTPAPTPAPKAKEPQVKLEALAGPKAGSNGTNAPPPQPQAPQWTRAAIAGFYSDVQKGRYRNNPEKKAQIEASIAQAMTAGAIQ